MVAVGGASIDAFDEDNYKGYYDSSADWLKGIMNTYEGNPYKKLIDMAQKAQKYGVIKVSYSIRGNQQWTDRLAS